MNAPGSVIGRLGRAAAVGVTICAAAAVGMAHTADGPEKAASTQRSIEVTASDGSVMRITIEIVREPEPEREQRGAAAPDRPSRTDSVGEPIRVPANAAMRTYEPRRPPPVQHAPAQRTYAFTTVHHRPFVRGVCPHCRAARCTVICRPVVRRKPQINRGPDPFDTLHRRAQMSFHRAMQTPRPHLISRQQ